MFDVTTNTKHRVLLMTTYGGGLRVAELVHLKPQDIHSERLLIRVNQGKGHKDRYTLLSPRLLEELRAYWREYRPKEWLFPNGNGSGPLPEGTAQKLFYRAKERARIRHGHGIWHGDYTPASAGSGRRSSSNGLWICPRCLLVTCKYWAVVLRRLCPINRWMVGRSTPASIKCVAKECRNEWMPCPCRMRARSLAR